MELKFSLHSSAILLALLEDFFLNKFRFFHIICEAILHASFITGTTKSQEAHLWWLAFEIKKKILECVIIPMSE